MKLRIAKKIIAAMHEEYKGGLRYSAGQLMSARKRYEKTRSARRNTTIWAAIAIRYY